MVHRTDRSLPPQEHEHTDLAVQRSPPGSMVDDDGDVVVVVVVVVVAVVVHHVDSRWGTGRRAVSP